MPTAPTTLGEEVRDLYAEAAQRIADRLAGRVYSPRITLLSASQVSEATGYSAAKIGQMVDRGEFPRPLDVPGQRRWSESSIVAWVKAKDPNVTGGVE